MDEDALAVLAIKSLRGCMSSCKKKREKGSNIIARREIDTFLTRTFQFRGLGSV